MPNKPSSQPTIRPGGTNQTLTVLIAVLVILVSGFWIWRTQFAGTANNEALHQAVGRVLAEQTAQVVGPTGKIVIVSMASGHSPELKVQVKTFEKELKGLGHVTIRDWVVLDPGDNPKYRPGSGLSAKRFLKIARKHPGVDAFVSFIGAPQMTDAELAELNPAPKLIAETHSPEKLTNLFARKILVAAVVPRFQFPAPGPKKPQTGQQWFDRYYQVLESNSTIPKPDDNP